MHPGRELSEEEQRTRRAGLRLLARMIARQMLADRAAAADPKPTAQADRLGRTEAGLARGHGPEPAR